MGEALELNGALNWITHESNYCMESHAHGICCGFLQDCALSFYGGKLFL